MEVGASGHNALDLTLSYYLGQTAQRSPGSAFCIVSKDKDFEAMLGHLQGRGIKVTRHDSFATLPFLPKPRKSHLVKAAAPIKAVVPAQPATVVQVADSAERLEKLIVQLRTNVNQRPKKRDRLLPYINTVFGGKLGGVEQTAKLDELVRRGILTIDAKGRVSY